MTAGIATKTTGPRHRRATRPTGVMRLVIVLIAVVCAAVLAFAVAESSSAAPQLSGTASLGAVVQLL